MPIPYYQHNTFDQHEKRLTKHDSTGGPHGLVFPDTKYGPVFHKYCAIFLFRIQCVNSTICASLPQTLHTEINVLLGSDTIADISCSSVFV